MSSQFHWSPEMYMHGKCLISQSVGALDSKCTMVPVVSNGTKTSSHSIPSSCVVSKGLSCIHFYAVCLELVRIKQ